MAQRQALRGAALDEAIDKVLAEMISIGLEHAPISRAEVQQRLGLTSRATLVGERGRRIESARAAQLQESGKEPDSTRRRRSLEERIASLQAENAILIRQRDSFYEALFAISQNCMVRGLDIEEILSPLRKR
jgi:hypothetical protein